jgi:hypothetical protein
MASILRLTPGTQAMVGEYFHGYHGRNFGLMILRDHNHLGIVRLTGNIRNGHAVQ